MIKVAIGVWHRPNVSGLGTEFFMAQRHHGHYNGCWEMPGGKLEEGETPEQALCREWKEELDLDIVVGEKIHEKEYVANRTPFLAIVFLVQVPAGSEFFPKLTTHSNCAWGLPAQFRYYGLNGALFTPTGLPILDVLETLTFPRV